MHFWVGSFCGILDGSSNKPAFPRRAIAVTDVIALIEEIGNQIPEKSWMLYLLELFNKHRNIAIELNLICQFDNQNYFEAIFNGVNRCGFKEVYPYLVIHTFIKLYEFTKTIHWLSASEDRNPKQTERFDLFIENMRRICF